MPDRMPDRRLMLQNQWFLHDFQDNHERVYVFGPLLFKNLKFLLCSKSKTKESMFWELGCSKNKRFARQKQERRCVWTFDAPQLMVSQCLAKKKQKSQCFWSSDAATPIVFSRCCTKKRTKHIRKRTENVPNAREINRMQGAHTECQGNGPNAKETHRIQRNGRPNAKKMDWMLDWMLGQHNRPNAKKTNRMLDRKPATESRRPDAGWLLRGGN